MQGLHHVLGTVDGMELNVEHRLHQLETALAHLTNDIKAQRQGSVEETSKRLSSVEQKLDALVTRLAQLEQHRYKSTPKRQGYPYRSQVPQSLELQPYAPENLAKRLGVDMASLAREQKHKSQSEFESWSRQRDPSSTGWRFNEGDRLYHPVK